MKYLTLIFFCLSCTTIHAQSVEDSVKAAVNRLFQAMKTADSAMLVSSFAEHAVLQTIFTGKDGATEVKNESVKAFAALIAKEARDAADERITFDVVKVDGPLATVWAPYQFYYKGKFSHCGVDAFQLIRMHGNWSIQYLIDTRRKQNCK